MSTQVYNCPVHGHFELRTPMSAPVKKVERCPVYLNDSYRHCLQFSSWVPSAPASIHVEGGTGAGKGRR